MTSVTLNQAIAHFSLPANGGQTIALDDLRGQWIVLFFYPKDQTPGCTQEGQDFRDLYEQFCAHHACVLGVSRDTVASHEKFIEKYQFPFALLSDTEEMLCNQFDVIKMKNMYGKQVRGIERSTFLIDPNGVLRAQWRKVKVEDHALEVLSKLKELS